MLELVEAGEENGGRWARSKGWGLCRLELVGAGEIMPVAMPLIPVEENGRLGLGVVFLMMPMAIPGEESGRTGMPVAIPGEKSGRMGERD